VPPRLLAAGRRFDLAVVDGNYRFDAVYIDLRYPRRLLGPAGSCSPTTTSCPASRRGLVPRGEPRRASTTSALLAAPELSRWALTRLLPSPRPGTERSFVTAPVEIYRPSPPFRTPLCAPSASLADQRLHARQMLVFCFTQVSVRCRMTAPDRIPSRRTYRRIFCAAGPHDPRRTSSQMRMVRQAEATTPDLLAGLQPRWILRTGGRRLDRRLGGCARWLSFVTFLR
jgi:hypothetical protein